MNKLIKTTAAIILAAIFVFVIGCKKNRDTNNEDTGSPNSGNNYDCYFSGTPFNNTTWNVPISYDVAITGKIRQTDNEGGYYIENISETSHTSFNYIVSIKNNILKYNSDNNYTEFIGDSIIEHSENGIQRYRNAITQTIITQNGVEKTTYTAFLSDDKLRFTASVCGETQTYYDMSNTGRGDILIYEITIVFIINPSDHTCEINGVLYNDFHVTECGYDYVGALNYTDSASFSCSGTWEYGANKDIKVHLDNRENSFSNKPSVFGIIPNIPLR